MEIDISKYSKAEVLKVLYDGAGPLGLGTLYRNVSLLTIEIAEDLLKEQTYFDYLRGRVMKVELGGDTLDPRLYDRDNGSGSAEQAINSLSKVAK